MKFLLGFGVGAVLGILFAPARGEQTRAELAEKARQLIRVPRQRAHEKLEQAAERAREEAGEVGSRVGRQAAEAAVKTVTSNLLGDKGKQTA